MTEMNCLPDTVEQSAVDQVTVTSDQGQIQMQRRGANDAVGHVGHLLARNTAHCLDDRLIKGDYPIVAAGRAGRCQNPIDPVVWHAVAFAEVHYLHSTTLGMRISIAPVSA